MRHTPRKKRGVDLVAATYTRPAYKSSAGPGNFKLNFPIATRADAAARLRATRGGICGGAISTRADAAGQLRATRGGIYGGAISTRAGAAGRLRVMRGGIITPQGRCSSMI